MDSTVIVALIAGAAAVLAAVLPRLFRNRKNQSGAADSGRHGPSKTDAGIQSQSGATPAQLAELNDLYRVCAAPSHAARMVTATGEMDVSPLLARVACPTLLLHCRRALLIPIEEVRLVASSIPGARFVPLDTNNYHPLEGEPAFARMMEEILAFLPRERHALAGLTRREREVLELLARGLENDDIAAQLEISEKTVRNTVSHVFDKLGVRTRAQAVVAARKAGLGD